MPAFKTWIIPDDYDPIETQWSIVTMCVPNTQQWRGIITGLVYGLTRGRNWDEKTGTITEVQQIAQAIFGSLTMDCNNDFTRIADALDSIRAVMAGPTPSHTYLDYFQQLEALGGSVMAGDTIMVSLQKMVDRMPTDMTLGELIAELETANDPSFKDFLELLTYLQQLFPNLPNLPFAGLFQLISMMFEARHKHTHSTAMVLQAQHLWGIQNALTAYQGTEDNEMGDAVGELWETLQNTPWLTTAIGALVDPSPAGEVAFSAKVVLAATQVWDRVTNWWASFRDSYLNQIVEPVPTTTVTGQLAEIAKRLQNIDTGDSSGGLGDISTLFATLNAALGEINQSIEEDMTITQNNNQTVNCGGGCDGALGSDGTWIPDQSPVGTPLDKTPYEPTDPVGINNYPSGFQSYNLWLEYRCKASNSMVLNLAESLYQVYEVAQRQHPSNTHSLVVRSVTQTLISFDFMYGFGWLYDFDLYNAIVSWEAESIADYLYPTVESEPFNIFTDLRLEVLANKQEWVCGIYNSPTTGDVESFLTTEAVTFINGTSYTQAEKDWAIGIFQDMLSIAWLSIPFTYYDNVAGFSDDTATDCALCSDNLYLTGTTFMSAGSDNNSSDGDGEPDGAEAGPYGYVSWNVTLDTPQAIVAGAILECNWRFGGDGQINWYLYATIDGIEYQIDNWDFQGAGQSGWLGAALTSYAGQDLEAVRWRAVDRGIGPDPVWYLDGCRLRNWQG